MPDIVSCLIENNFDHHDGNNPWKTSTEVVFGQLNRLKGTYAVIADQVIDADNVCATFASLNPKMAGAHRRLLIEVARYSDYYEEVSDAAMRVALTIDAMRFGENKFGHPFFKLSPEQQGELFNEILDKIPQMLTRIELFKSL